MFKRPSFTSSTMEPQASATRMQSRSRASDAVVGRKEDEPVAPVAGLGAVVADVLQHGVEGQARLFARVEVLGRQNDQAQRAVVRHVRVRGENVDAVEERGATGQLLEHLGQFAAHVVSCRRTAACGPPSRGGGWRGCRTRTASRPAPCRRSCSGSAAGRPGG